MDVTSEIESQGRESKMDTDAATVPTELTDQFFSDLQSKCLAVSHSNVQQMRRETYIEPFSIFTAGHL